MAIYWFDPHKAVTGIGTFADPYGMLHTNNRPTVVNSGDECRILGKPLSALLTATEYTVTVRDFASSSSGYSLKLNTAAQYTDFVQYDIVYFPEYDVFMRLTVAFNASGIALHTYYSDIPIPCGRDKVTTMRRVDPTQISTNTGSSWYLLTNTAAAFPNGGITATDCWINETTRVTDGTVKTLLANSTTGTAQFLISSTTLALTNRQGVNFTRSTFDFSNTHIIPSRAASPAINVVNHFPYSDTVMKQQASAGSGTPLLTFGNNATKTTQDSTYRVKDLCSYSAVTVTGDNNFVLTVDRYVGHSYAFILIDSESFTQFAANAVINLGDSYSQSSSTRLVSLVGANNTTINLTGKFYMWSNATVCSYLVNGGGDFVLNYSPTFEWITNLANGAVTNKITQINSNLIYDTSSVPVSKEDFYRVPALPPGFSFAGSQAFVVSHSPTHYVYQPLRAAMRALLIENLNTPTFGLSNSLRWTNLQVLSTDNKFEPFEVLGIYDWQYISALIHTQYFVASKDYLTFHTNAPSLKFELQTYTAILWTVTNGASKPYSVKNITVPTVQGNSYTISMKVRTDDASFVAGDFSVHLCRANGDVIGSNVPTVSMLNNWATVTFTYTAGISEEIYLAFKMHGYRAGQRYWVSDLVVS